MDFRYTGKREYKSHAQRSTVMVPGAAVATSHPLASMAGFKAMEKGGNAVDAAIAAAAVLSVVEPYSVGLGGDAFAMIYMSSANKVFGMNGSGRAPAKISIENLMAKGFKRMPERGAFSITVPGALMGWHDAVSRFGRLKFSQCLEDAIFYAENGFPVTEVISGEWADANEVLKAMPESARIFLPSGHPPFPGERFKNHDLAKTLKIISNDGIEAFYKGDIARKIEKTVTSQGGCISMEDLASHKTDWVEPLEGTYRGYRVMELPPNGQGIIALELLNLLENYDIASMGHNSPDYLHILIEGKKLTFADRNYYISDPEKTKIPLAELLSRQHADYLCSNINMSRAMEEPLSPLINIPCSETVYITAMDEERNAVSFISSLFMHFGSGIVPEGTGFSLQNRGYSFSLDPSHPNHLAPGKRPMHTIIPAMLFSDDRFLMSFGVMGGDMQVQGHAQFLANIIDFGMNPQEAMDAPRVRHVQGKEVYFEDGIPEKTVKELEKRGHQHYVPESEQGNQVGGGQAIYFDREHDVLLAASDRRKDGCAVGR